jgi:ankyrin repeat protein
MEVTMTAQFGELLLYDGNRHEITETPLDSYFELNGIDPKFYSPHTALWRGYVGSWEIVENKLYLVELDGQTENVTIVGNCMDVDVNGASMDTFFPHHQGRVFADWFTGTISIPQGDLLEHLSDEYCSVYEREIVLRVENGVATATWTRNNKIPPSEQDIELIDATRAGDMVRVEAALRQGADVHTKNDEPLFCSVEQGNLAIVAHLLDHGANIQAKYLLRTAVRSGNFGIVDCLLKHGINVRANNDEALITAADCGSVDLIKRLLTEGANVHANNESPLWNAASISNIEALEYLISQGAIIREDRHSALLSAAKAGNLPAVEFLLAVGANVNANHGEALTLAVRAGDLAMVERLLSAGVALHPPGPYYHDDALSVAAGCGNLTMVKCLLKYGADVHIDKDAPMQWAISNEQTEIVKYLAAISPDGGSLSDEKICQIAQKACELFLESQRKQHSDVSTLNADFSAQISVLRDEPRHRVTRAILKAVADHNQAGRPIHARNLCLILGQIAKKGFALSEEQYLNFFGTPPEAATSAASTAH